jgi:hypothetical protein
VEDIENNYQFKYPPDLRAFLMHTLPTSPRFPNWRDSDQTQIIKMLSWPYEGICFDIEFNNFWLSEWGIRPSTLPDAFAIAKQALEHAPKLIPVYGHRYIPDTPSKADNPIFSIYQTDIIYYGADLTSYFKIEFSSPGFAIFAIQETDIEKNIPFWTDLLILNNTPSKGPSKN